MASPVAASRTRALSIAAYAEMLVYGMVMALLGAILPVIAAHLNVDVARAGTVFSVLGAGMLVSGFAAGPVIDRFGSKAPMLVGPALSGIAVWGMAGVGTFSGVIACVALLGLGGGVINNVSNAVVAALYDDPKQKGSALNLLGTMFGVGALTLPFAIGGLLATVGLAAILRTAAVACVAVAIGALLPSYPKPAHTEFSRTIAVRLARRPDLLALGSSLFLQSGNEFVLSGFIATYLTVVFGTTVSAASYVLAVYWTSILISRLVVSRASLRFPGPAILVVGATGAAAGVLLLALAPELSWAIGGVILLGFCISSIFPTTLGVASVRFSTYLGTAFGILFAMSLAGGMIVPPIFGEIASKAGLRAALGLPVAGFCGIALIHVLYTTKQK